MTKRAKILIHFNEWLKDEDRLEPGELYTLRHPKDEALSFQSVDNRYMPIGAGGHVPTKSSMWKRNTPINPYVASIIEVSTWHRRVQGLENADDWLGLIMHQEYRYMKYSSLFDEMMGGVRRTLPATETISGVLGSLSLWLKYDKYVFVPVAYLVHSKSTGKQSIRAWDRSQDLAWSKNTFTALSPVLDRPAYVPKEKK